MPQYLMILYIENDLVCADWYATNFAQKLGYAYRSFLKDDDKALKQSYRGNHLS